MAKIIVLGAGMVGRTIALDLAQKHQVTSADIDKSALETLATQGIETLPADLSNSNTIQKMVKPFDVVVGAVPGFMGFNMANAVIGAGKHLVDISFFPEDPFKLKKLAEESGSIAITDCGVAPGMSNLILGYHHQRMSIDNFECYVGGLPKERKWPYEYKAPFSPIDVIEEYTRPARYVVGGKEVIKPALSEAELMDFEPVGKLEAFNTDGLRSLVYTIDVPNMKEKTLRYPGHIRLMEVLRESGFFSTEPMEVNGTQVTPLEVNSKLLFDQWKLGTEEPEFTIMRVVIEGAENDKKVTYQYDLYDEYDPITKTSSMSRTTGYTCTAAVELLLDKDVTRPGIYPAELIGARDNCLDKVFAYLKERGVNWRMQRTEH